MSTLTRTIALSVVLAALLSAAKTPDTPYNLVAKLAEDLTESNVNGALSAFDSSMEGYGKLAQNVESLVAQTTITSAIDVVEDSENNGVHLMHLDWYLTLTLMSDPTRTERRREQVTVEMRQIKGKWKITSMKPLTILDAVAVL